MAASSLPRRRTWPRRPALEWLDLLRARTDKPVKYLALSHLRRVRSHSAIDRRGRPSCT